MGLPAGKINDFFRDKQGSMERVNPSERCALPYRPRPASLNCGNGLQYPCFHYSNAVMNTTTALLTLAIAAWLAQIVLGYWQISRFNRAYTALARDSAYLGVGRSNGRFTPKVLIILALDSEQRVRDSILMQGLTIFAAPQKLTQLHGMKFSDIDPAAVFPQRPRHQQALASALTRKD
jgi:glucitol operon activator protein